MVGDSHAVSLILFPGLAMATYMRLWRSSAAVVLSWRPLGPVIQPRTSQLPAGPEAERGIPVQQADGSPSRGRGMRRERPESQQAAVGSRTRRDLLILLGPAIGARSMRS